MTTDTGYAPERWEFDAKVTEVFDDMLTRSIPDYHTMRQLVARLAGENVIPNSVILDLGCSRGDNIASIIEHIKTEKPALSMLVKYVGVEISDPMIEAAKNTLEEPIASGRVDIQKYDLRKGLSADGISVICSVLTLMFVPMEYRIQLLQNIYDTLPKKGAFILVEKMLGNTALLNQIMVDTYHDMKRVNGYSPEDIKTKAESLEGVLVPLPMSTNIDMLKTVGFKDIDCFWRWMNFGGIIAIK